MKPIIRDTKLRLKRKTLIENDVTKIIYSISNVKKRKDVTITSDVNFIHLIVEDKKKITNIYNDNKFNMTLTCGINVLLTLIFSLSDCGSKYKIKIGGKAFIKTISQGNNDIEYIEEEEDIEDEEEPVKLFSIQQPINENYSEIINKLEIINNKLDNKPLTKNISLNTFEKVEDFCLSIRYNEKTAIYGLNLEYKIGVANHEKITNIKLVSQENIILYYISNDDIIHELNECKTTNLIINPISQLQNFQISFFIEKPNYQKDIKTEFYIEDKLIKVENYHFNTSQILLSEINYLKEEDNYVVYFSIAKRNVSYLSDVLITVEFDDEAIIEDYIFINRSGVFENQENENISELNMINFNIDRLSDDFLTSERNFVKITVKNLTYCVVNAKCKDTESEVKYLQIR
jgi:hypothetical protein